MKKLNRVLNSKLIPHQRRMIWKMILFFRCFFLSINSLHKIFVVFIRYIESCRHCVLCNEKFIFFNGVIYIIIYYSNAQVSSIFKLNKNYPRDKKKYSIVAIMRDTIIIYYTIHLPKLKKQKQLCPLYV